MKIVVLVGTVYLLIMHIAVYLSISYVCDKLILFL